MVLGGTVAVTAGEIVSISGAGQWVIQHNVEHRECRGRSPCPFADTWAMGRWWDDFGATSGGGKRR